MRSTFLVLLVVSALARAETYETGTLRGLLLGHCSTCAYDNWTSHVVEGAVRSSYNDYGTKLPIRRKMVSVISQG